jgi:glycosyltransferase involved in cell wall biosynthesis
MLRHMVEVSVLIAAFKPSYLAEALRSALAQTQTGLEVVVVDDSLGDEIKRIVNETSDHRVRYFRNPERLGPAASHSRAIDEATAPILGVLNDDDVWEPTLVERLFAALRAEPDAVLAFGDHWVMLDGRKDAPPSEPAQPRRCGMVAWVRSDGSAGRALAVPLGAPGLDARLSRLHVGEETCT